MFVSGWDDWRLLKNLKYIFIGTTCVVLSRSFCDLFVVLIQHYFVHVALQIISAIINLVNFFTEEIKFTFQGETLMWTPETFWSDILKT